MKGLNSVALALMVIGGINWGLVGLFDFNLVSAIFGIDSWFTNLIYILVGLASLYGFYLFYPLTKGTEVTQRGQPAAERR